MYTVYVLKSGIDGRLYKGMTRDIDRRISEHRRGKTITTRTMGHIELVHAESYQEFVIARERELYLKTAAGRRFLKIILGNKGI